MRGMYERLHAISWSDFGLEEWLLCVRNSLHVYRDRWFSQSRAICSLSAAATLSIGVECVL